jgi:hypothetical protein
MLNTPLGLELNKLRNNYTYRFADRRPEGRHRGGRSGHGHHHRPGPFLPFYPPFFGPPLPLWFWMLAGR